ncbi:hypothetical protein Ahy_A06g030056 isoform C [Arachis hypogaea]|uniref:E3 ubiquitin protein ligase n=1 Tax=Arachis hypogaea TaxID=3818 RepID=A0A445CV18_ARAHY|nr:hypothetical protein Ahy_A06g030056 isoform C [Arachis hypogaea]
MALPQTYVWMAAHGGKPKIRFAGNGGLPKQYLYMHKKTCRNTLKNTERTAEREDREEEELELDSAAWRAARGSSGSKAAWSREGEGEESFWTVREEEAVFCRKEAEEGELERILAELEESNSKLFTLKAERDSAKGAVLPVLNVGTAHVASDKVRDKQKDLQDMESTLKDLLDQGSSRLVELKGLHEERIRILQQLCDLQNTLKNLDCITSSHCFQLVRDQIEKSKAEVHEYQALFEKLQVEKDNLVWKEREWYIKNDLADIFQRSVSVADSRVADLRSEIQKKIDERNVIENKLHEEAREPGRNQVIGEFKSLLSSFPEEMESMQSQLSKYKESASDIHSLRADVQSISNILDRKVKECDVFTVRAAGQAAEIKRLLGVVVLYNEQLLDMTLYSSSSCSKCFIRLENQQNVYEEWTVINIRVLYTSIALNSLYLMDVSRGAPKLSSVKHNCAYKGFDFGGRFGFPFSIWEFIKKEGKVEELRESERDLKLILEMFRRESIDSSTRDGSRDLCMEKFVSILTKRAECGISPWGLGWGSKCPLPHKVIPFGWDIMEAREAEYRAWANIQSLKTSLDEHGLELRVKTANEAEAKSQQRLAAAEAEIAAMRQKLEDSKKEMSELSVVLRSKNGENEAYLSEIESIGQAYDEKQTQNQHMLQQITERDDYNIKLVLEGVRARQKQDSLVMEKRVMQHEIQQANVTRNLYDSKAARIEDQLKFCSDQIQRLIEDKMQSSVTLENTHRRLLDVRRSSQQVKDTVTEVQSKSGSSRVTCMELHVELEKERFSKKRIEEELEVSRRKLSRLKAQNEGCSVIERLQEELAEYREIVKCSICQDRTKEVVITKCYHLFCGTCIQKVSGSRHRKCPQCSTSFGANDVKPVYL